jgi:hypothetical protein
MLAKFVAETNIDEALRYCALAEKVKNERLPFLQQNFQDQDFLKGI